MDAPSVAGERVEMSTPAKSRAIPALGAASALLMVVFLYLSFFYAPEDLAQGPVQRVFYPHVGSAWGTMWHGSLECDDFRRAWLSEVAREAGSPWQPRDGGRGFAALRERMIETTADGIETHIDVEALLGLAR